ncbi:NF-kappa-B inhibitor zeta isoform X1 [Paramormyrops kingsleyae]|uniref:NF-kappa-B inhibitor zeta isoform X1 n=1 Tax=Paramormyrops kingsleyae TaxID=1676925 RepID=UPI003B972A80
MIIETTADDLGVLMDQEGVMTGSPWSLWSFFGNSSSPPESVGARSPESPSSDSDSGKTWTVTRSHSETCAFKKGAQGDSLTVTANLKATYQGVRVKNPVKELIMQKRGMQVRLFSKGVDNCSALTTDQQGINRPALRSPPGISSPKKPASCQYSPVIVPDTYLGNIQVLCCHGDVDGPLKDNVQSPEHFLGICDITSDSRECSPVSLMTVQVQESPCPPQMDLVGSPPQMNFLSQKQEPSPFLPNDNLSFYTPPKSMPSCLHEQNQVPSYLPQTGITGPFPTPFTPQPDPAAFSMPFTTPSTQILGGMSFFQWQIRQEEEKLQRLTPDQLAVQDGDGDTILNIAVAQGRRALAFVLARKMAEIGMLDIKERNSQSALQVGVAANQHLIVQDLLTLGAQINTFDQWGRTPLHVCAEKGHALMLQAVQRTMQASMQQVDMEAINYEGLTALHVAVLSHNAVIQELEHVSPLSPQAETLLQKRKFLGECVSTLMAMGSSYKSKDRKSGRTALHIASEEANVELLRLFLDQPDSLSVINEKTYNGNTVLHVASSLQGRVAQVDAVKLLMRRGADPSAKNLENEQPIQLVPEGPQGDQVSHCAIHLSPQYSSVSSVPNITPSGALYILSTPSSGTHD